MVWATHSPRPVPDGLVVKNGSKIRAASWVAMPPPVSPTITSTLPSRARAGKNRETLDDLRRAHGLFSHRAQGRLELAGRQRLAPLHGELEELDSGKDDGEGIPKLVGNTGGQAGQRRGLVRQQPGSEGRGFVAGRGAARHRPDTHKNYSSRSPPNPTDELVNGLEGLIHAAKLLCASLSQLGTTSATAAGGLRHLLNQSSGMEARDQVLAHGRHQVGPPVLDARDADDARAEPLSQTVHHRTQALGVEPVHTAGDDGHAVDLAGPVHELVGARPRQPGLHLLELLLQRPLLVDELAQPLRDLAGRDLQDVGGLLEGSLLPRDRGQRGRPGHSLHAPDAGGDGALASHLEEADLAGLVQMRAATELHGKVADPDDRDALAVLLAEERERARAQRFVEVHLLARDLDVGLDLLVDEVLDLLHLAVLDGRAVGEVEAQVIGRHQRAGLRDVRAEHLAERGVEQMRPGVVLAQALAARRLHADRHVFALAEAPAAHAHAVDEKLRAAVVRVDDLATAVAPDERAG